MFTRGTMDYNCSLILLRPDKFLDSQVETLIQYVCRFLLDPKTSTCVIELESLLETLITFFTETSWQSQSLSNLCELLCSRIVTSNHQNFLTIVQHIPLISQRGKQLKTHLCMYKLPKMFTSKQFSAQVISRSLKTFNNFMKAIWTSSSESFGWNG